MKRRIITPLLALLAAASIFLGACGKDSLEFPVSGKLKYEDINSVEVLSSVLYSAYRLMATDAYYGRYMVVLGELRSENCMANLNAMYMYMEYNAGKYIVPENYDILNLWTNMYKAVAATNAVIAHETAFSGNKEAQFAVGQAYGLRALIHYDLLRVFGAQHSGSSVTGIPYATAYPPKNLTMARNSVDEVKTQLYADIDKAITLLKAGKDDEKLTGGQNAMNLQVYLNYYAAHVLRARMALWFGEWEKALQSLKEVENSNQFRILDKNEYVASWRKKLNPNSIFELAITAAAMTNTLSLAQTYHDPDFGAVAPTQYLKNLFEANDIRGSEAMIGENVEQRKRKEKANEKLHTYLANLGKYPDHKNNTDNIVLMRYEEVVLMKAEALFRIGDLAGALAALNSIAAQRGASLHTEATEDAILLERQKELCFEGFRFDDLARFKRSVDEKCEVKGTGDFYKDAYKYGTKKFTLPIPAEELRANPNLVQTDGFASF